MNLKLHKSSKRFDIEIVVSGSKSESNRLLILQQFYPNLFIDNLSNSDDTSVLKNILNSPNNLADVHHAGTAMRFLTAFFACQEGSEMVLKGSDRMHQRPIMILVDALRSLGAVIEYIDKDGYPPLKITGKRFCNSEVFIRGDVSSQYISALLLIAPSLKNGLKINLEANVTSRPYIEMTLQLLQKIGVTTKFVGSCIEVYPFKEIANKTIVVESDWSSASYWYSVVALSDVGTKIKLSAYTSDSLQGDSILSKIYTDFGVETIFLNNQIILVKVNTDYATVLSYDLVSSPDIAQTIAVTSFGLGISCSLKGLHTLKIKETDRLVALKNELEKLGAIITLSDSSINVMPNVYKENIEIETYDDHRMAMSFAPLALCFPLTILGADVVSKSYPNFWKEFKKIKNT